MYYNCDICKNKINENRICNNCFFKLIKTNNIILVGGRRIGKTYAFAEKEKRKNAYKEGKNESDSY